jgi:hypothetical protein
MSHAIAQARFADRLILFGEFSEQLGHYCTRLHYSRAAVYRHSESGSEASCHCGRDEPVILATEADYGHWIVGRACRYCLAVTIDPLANLDSDRPLPTAGLPDWWVKL